MSFRRDVLALERQRQRDKRADEQSARQLAKEQFKAYAKRPVRFKVTQGETFEQKDVNGTEIVFGDLLGEFRFAGLRFAVARDPWWKPSTSSFSPNFGSSGSKLENKFRVSEMQTGISVGHGASKAAAVAYAKEKLQTHGVARVKEKIGELIGGGVGAAVRAAGCPRLFWNEDDATVYGSSVSGWLVHVANPTSPACPTNDLQVAFYVNRDGEVRLYTAIPEKTILVFKTVEEAKRAAEVMVETFEAFGGNVFAQCRGEGALRPEASALGVKVDISFGFGGEK